MTEKHAAAVKRHPELDWSHRIANLYSISGSSSSRDVWCGNSNTWTRKGSFWCCCVLNLGLGPGHVLIVNVGIGYGCCCRCSCCGTLSKWGTKKGAAGWCCNAHHALFHNIAACIFTLDFMLFFFVNLSVPHCTCFAPRFHPAPFPRWSMGQINFTDFRHWRAMTGHRDGGQSMICFKFAH